MPEQPHLASLIVKEHQLYSQPLLDSQAFHPNSKGCQSLGPAPMESSLAQHEESTRDPFLMGSPPVGGVKGVVCSVRLKYNLFKCKIKINVWNPQEKTYKTLQMTENTTGSQKYAFHTLFLHEWCGT